MELLEGLPGDVTQQVLAIARRRRFRRGQAIFYDGDPADTLHLIAKGKVAVRVTTGLGETATIDVLGRGDVVGELAVVPPAAPRSATAIALEPVETLAVTESAFAELRDRYPQVTEVLIAIMARRLRLLPARLAEALYLPADVRVLRRLVAVAELYESEGSEAVVQLTQEDLAGLAGTTRETVNRVLRREAGYGTVSLTRGRITVLDIPALSKRAD